jgi:hypothetical protein
VSNLPGQREAFDSSPDSLRVYLETMTPPL